MYDLIIDRVIVRFAFDASIFLIQRNVSRNQTLVEHCRGLLTVHEIVQLRVGYVALIRAEIVCRGQLGRVQVLSLHFMRLLDLVLNDQMLHGVIFWQLKLVVVDASTILVVRIVSKGVTRILRVRLLVMVDLGAVNEIRSDLKSLQLLHH